MSKPQNLVNLHGKEEWNLFIYNLEDDRNIITVENIGITYPDPNYHIVRTKEQNNYFVFEYVISGKGYLEVDGNKYSLNEGDVYILEPGKAHRYYSDKKDPFKKIWINIFGDFFIDIFKRLGIWGKVHFPNMNCLEIFYELHNLTNISTNSDDICIKAASILFKLVCTIADSQRQLSIKSSVAKSVKQILDANIYSNITTAELVTSLNISKSKIIKEFKDVFGVTPHNYLLTQKITIAKNMLIRTDFTIAEISEKLALNDAHYFSRLFLKKAGITPSDFRKKNRL